MIIDYFRKKTKSFQENKSTQEAKARQTIDNLFDSNENWTDYGDELFETEDKSFSESEELNSLLTKCLEELPERWKLAVLSKYILGKEGKEICQELEITPSNYWQIIRRAKLLLKLCLQKNWNR
ncbi:MAG TPA: sigma-70 family RNA polymerase sigma factor [Saprospiraceae bacterium]|nr:sigma-70 family RNA polymerase sigma factor [Saprospiraceae bacterium]